MRRRSRRNRLPLGRLAVGALGLLTFASIANGCVLGRQGELAQQCTADPECDDGNPCSSDSCSPDGICVREWAPDGPAPIQTAGDCLRTQCTGGTPSEQDDPSDGPADDGNSCTGETCADGVPSHVPLGDGASCRDGAGHRGLCVGIVCSVQCTPETSADCEQDGEPCTVDSCDATTGQCVSTDLSGVAAPEQVAADCRLVVCADGASQPTIDNYDVFDDGNPCTADICDSGIAMNVPFEAGAPCDADGGRVCDGDPVSPSCVECVASTDCPGVPGFCMTPTCVGATCGEDFAALGTPVGPQIDGDCLTDACDGQGATTTVIDPLDFPDDDNLCTDNFCVGSTPDSQDVAVGEPCGILGSGLTCDGSGNCTGCDTDSPEACGDGTPCLSWECDGSGTCVPSYVGENVAADDGAQVANDCLLLMCDGEGNVDSVVDDSDVPIDDGNDCTVEACLDGNAVHPPRAINEPCSSGGGAYCDGAGACVECNVASQCPDPGVACRRAVCTAHVCGIADVASGVPAAPGYQAAGDCRILVCDGGGGTTSQVDDSDVPWDGNDCTQDLCAGGSPSNPLEAEGTPCGPTDIWACDAAGHCIECAGNDECTAPDVCDTVEGRCECAPEPCSRCANEWAHGHGDGAHEQYAEDVAFGAGDTLAVVGRFKGTVDFGTGPIPGHTAKYDGFTAVYEPNGTARWVRVFGDGAQDQSVLGAAVADDGAVLVAGKLKGTVNFGSGSVSSAGNKFDAFVTCYEPDGAVRWVKTIGNDTQDQEARAVAVDEAGNVFVTGRIKDPVDFGNGAPIGHSAKFDLFIASYDPSGTYRWAHTLGNDTDDQDGNSIAVDGVGNVYAVGSIKGLVDLGGGALGHAGKRDLFVAAYDSDGSHLWSDAFGNGAQDQIGEAVAVTPSGTVFVTGRIKEPVDFGSGTGIGHSAKYDLVLASVDSTGSYRWASAFGNDAQDQHGMDVAVDPSGNVVVTGKIKGLVDFGSGVAIGNSAKYDVVAALFDSAGSHLCSKAYGDGASDQIGAGVAALGSEQYALTGSFEGSVDFGGGPLASRAAHYDVFVARYGP